MVTKFESVNKQISESPNNPDLYILRANLFADDKKYVEALKDYDKAIELDPNNARLYYNRGKIYSKMNEYSKAILNYSKAINLNQDDERMYNIRGNAFLHNKENTKAISDFNKAIELNPKVAKFYCDRAYAYLVINEHSKAIEDYETAINLDPRNEDIYESYGKACLKYALYSQALENFNKAITLNNQSSHLFRSRGIAYFRIGQFHAAKNDFTMAIKLDSNDATNYYLRAGVYSQDNDHKRAIIDLGKAIDLNPKLSRLYVNRAFEYSEQKQYVNALNDYLKAKMLIKEVEDSPKYKYIISKILQMKAMLTDVSVSQIKNIDELMGSEEMIRIEKQVVENEQSFLDFISEGQKLNRSSISQFHILRRWNSYTPIIAKNNYCSKGGGYFFRTSEHGIVFDPGLNFIENFQEAGFFFNEIDFVFITHAHNDHVSDLESILTLLYKYNDKVKGDSESNYDKTIYEEVYNEVRPQILNESQEKQDEIIDMIVEERFLKSPRRKKIQIYMTNSTFKKYANFLDLNKKNDYEIMTINSNSKSIIIDNIRVDAIYAKHNDLISDRDSVGFAITCENTVLVYTGDTGFDDAIEKQYKEIKKKNRERKIVLLAHIGGFKKCETLYKIKRFNEGKAFYGNHLGRLGLARLVEILQPFICIISEFGEEFSNCRIDLCNIYQKVYQNTLFFPADIGFCIDSENRVKVITKIKPKTDYGYIDAKDVEVLEIEKNSSLHYFDRKIDRSKLTEILSQEFYEKQR